MATGPQKLNASAANLLTNAEKYIDSWINQETAKPICIPTDAIKISYEVFMSKLAPKYKTAGWSIVDWRYDENNNRYYIFLS